MKIIKQLTILLSLFFISCSRLEKNTAPSLYVVDIDKKSEFSTPSIDKDKINLFDDNNKYKKTKRLPVVCLVFGPGLNRAFVYSSILKAFEDEGVKIHMTTGFGMGLIFAGMYAKPFSSKSVEWNVYKFLDQKRFTFFSDDWNNNLKSHLYKSLDNENIQSFSKTFLFPFLDHKVNSIQYLKRGKFGVLFRSYSFNGVKAAFPNHVFDVAELKKMGADIIIGVDLLSDEISFEQPSGLLFGSYGKALSMQQKYSDSFDHIIKVPLSGMKLDQTSGLDIFFQKSYEFTRDELKIVKEKISTWNSTSL